MYVAPARPACQGPPVRRACYRRAHSASALWDGDRLESAQPFVSRPWSALVGGRDMSTTAVGVSFGVCSCALRLCWVLGLKLSVCLGSWVGGIIPISFELVGVDPKP